jgi:hypothetical protein
MVLINTKAEITGCTFSNNFTSIFGGGIVVHSGSTLTATNDTFYGNNGMVGGCIQNEGSLTLTNSTLAGNTATSDGCLYNQGQLLIRNTIIAQNTGSGNCSNTGTLTDGGYNLEDADSCGFSSEKHSLIKVNPLLSYPGEYDGVTRTLALLPGSPAIDQIPTGDNGCGTDIKIDQRGVKRPQGTLLRCDIGAFESRGFMAQGTGGDHQSTLVNTAFKNPLSLLIFSRYDEPVEGGRMSFTGPETGPGTRPSSNEATISASSSASLVVAANGEPGSYEVKANASGLKKLLTYKLTNKSNH